MTLSRTIRWLLLIAIFGLLGYFGWQQYHPADQAAAANNAQKAARNPVRVTIAPVQKTDFPVYLTGLGTVQGFNTVLVRTRVDGQIDKVAFKDAQLVKQATLLLETAPPPYQPPLNH